MSRPADASEDMAEITDSVPDPMLFEAGPAEHRESGAGEADAAASEDRELKAILETLLFVSHDPVTVDRLAAVLEGVPKAEIKQTLRRLQQDFEATGRGLQIVEVAGGFQIVTRADYGPWIKRFEKSKPAPKLTRSALETLAIIAYKQPLVRTEIEQIRGVETSGVLRTLLERKLVRMVGRKDMPGRPILYGTTKNFLQHFGLRDLSQLPPLREFKELTEAEQAQLPVGEEALVIQGSGTPDDTSETVQQETGQPV
ncbi:MAG TPA: SMC-Scp complex subunit ScpB [Nitrospiraceae bacterium]|nr:SMC-Scp complex subunit ScpB [Nitrospiraceae bacterium]